MSGVTLISTEVIRARKHHRCDYCGRSIAPGERYRRSALKYDDLYVWMSHLDCDEMALEHHRISNYGYCEDGIGPLYEDTDLLDNLDYWRGEYPHVVCRLELNIQLSDIRWRDRLIAKGIDPETHE